MCPCVVVADVNFVVLIHLCLLCFSNILKDNIKVTVRR